jgi:hypothetical protein
VALLGGTWFESGTWQAWKEAFELAGTSYCVTGHLLAGEDRIIAWSIGVPVILFCFGWIQAPWGKDALKQLNYLGLTLLLLALLAPFSTILALALTLNAGLILCLRIPKLQRGAQSHLATSGRIAFGLIIFSLLVDLAGSRHLLPLGKSADTVLVHGEIVRSLCDILSFVIPSLILLAIVLRESFSLNQSVPESLPLKDKQEKEKKPKPRNEVLPDPQTGLFGN